MSSLYSPPLIPGMGNPGQGPGAYAPSRSPFFSVGNQFLPRNLHDVIRWVGFITVQSPVTTEVLRKLATFPVTSFTYSSDDPAVRDKFEEIQKSFKLRTTLHDIGFQYYTIGNVFISLYFPIHRSLSCPMCKTHYSARNAEFIEFKAYNFIGKCPKCGNTTKFLRSDVKSKNVDDMKLIVWDALNISLNHNPISGRTEYYYKIPNEIKRQVQAGNMLYLDSLPWEMIEAIQQNKDFKFAPNTIYHMKNVDTGASANGISVPPLVSHFNLVFYQATLRRANESIATDFMAPMRVVFPQAQTGNSDPVVAVSMRNFASKMEEAFVNHKRDNNHVLIAPVPIGYQAISGEGKTLLVAQEIREAEESLLLSLGVSRELLSGSTNWTSSTVGLRMLKNTLDSYVSQLDEFLAWMSGRISEYLSIDRCNVSLTPFQLTDDEALKNVFLALSQTGKISMTTIYESMGRSYDEEQERILEDAKSEARFEVRRSFEIERAKYLEGVALSKDSEDTADYKAALEKANEVVQQIKMLDPNTLQLVMNGLKVQDFAQYVLVNHLLEQSLVSPIGQAAGGGGGDPNAEGEEGEGGPPGEEGESDFEGGQGPGNGVVQDEPGIQRTELTGTQDPLALLKNPPMTGEPTVKPNRPGQSSGKAGGASGPVKKKDTGTEKRPPSPKK